MTAALLVLEDGRAFRGSGFGAEGETIGEVVFSTSLTGYQEVLTDPSYRGQIVVMTAPHVGNYGITAEDEESDGPKVAGFVVRSACAEPSSWRSEEALPGYLLRHEVIGLQAVDTRGLVRHLRTRGTMMGAISTLDLDERSLVAKVRAAPGIVGRDLVSLVSPKEACAWYEPPPRELRSEVRPRPGPGPRVVVLDCGVKRTMLRELCALGCRVTLVPARTSASFVLGLAPDGMLISNGPGDPAAVPYAVETVRGLLGKVPVFGICLGHQLLALALGGRTYKLKFGHRGSNQPVRDLRTGRVYVSAHNHGFSVKLESLPAGEVEPWFVNLNDGTNEGLRCRTIPASSVQFHPEAAPGPNDCRHLLREFVESLRGGN